MDLGTVLLMEMKRLSGSWVSVEQGALITRPIW